MLLYTNGKARGIVEKGNLGAVARHRDNLQALVKEIDALKLRVEQTMFEAGKSAEDVGSWSSSIEEPIAEADEEVSRLEKWLVETNGEIEHRKHKDEEERKARAREEELKFEREQMEMKLEFERQLEETKAKQQPVEKANQIEQRTTKLPKLQITKFNGTYEAWLPFWNKFQAEIDKANLASVTKFAYLKELVDPKVRAEIDGPPFNRGLREGKEYPHRRIWENERDRKCVRPEHREFACHNRNTTCAYLRILQEARVQCAIFGNTGQIERRDWKCKECARQTKGCKSRSSKRKYCLAGLGLPTVDKSFEKLEGNQPHCERRG